MEKMINLKDLLMHEVQDLHSAEEQIMDALPGMISKANNASLKKALKDHLSVTEKQLTRLGEVKQLLMQGQEEDETEGSEKKGWLASLFGNGKHKCLGLEGLVKEGEKVMSEDMTPEVLDAAIIACAQKIEHYEICGYGTARAYARELNLGEVAELLEETLNEEYEADDLLTDLAVGRLNEKAEEGEKSTSKRSTSRSNGTAKKSASASKAGTTRRKKSAAKNKTASRSKSK
jgi:ferritin-like metal-binding protein YciE